MIASIQWVRLRTVILILLLLPLLCHCESAPPKKQLDKINLQLQWVHQGEFAWAYVAKEQGIFEEYGLNVTILPGGPDNDQAEANLKEGIHFGTLPIEALLETRQKGNSLIALAIIYQHSPLSFISLKKAGLISPQQFQGKKVSFPSHSDRAQFMSMLGKIGIDDPQISIQPYSYKFAGLFDGSVDVSGAYAIGGVQRLKSSDVELNVCWPFDYGVRFYGEALVAKEGYVQENQELTQRFVQAMLKSLQLVLADPQRATTDTMKYAKEKDATLQAAMIKTSLPLISPGDVHLGSIDPAKLQEMNQLLYNQKVLTSPDIWQTAYSLNYLP